MKVFIVIGEYEFLNGDNIDKNVIIEGVYDSAEKAIDKVKAIAEKLKLPFGNGEIFFRYEDTESTDHIYITINELE